MLKFHIIIIKFSIFTNKNTQSYMFFPKLKNTVVKIGIKSFSVCVFPLLFDKLRMSNTLGFIQTYMLQQI